MTGERKIVGMVLGFAAVAGVALMLVPSHASAQILDPPGGGAAADPRRRPQLRPSLLDYSDPTEEDRRAFDDGRFGLNETVPEVPGQSTAEAIGEADEGVDEDGGGLPEDATQRTRLAIPQDGDPVPVVEAPAPQDGVIDLGEPTGPVEGQEDITEADIRSPEDIRAFVNEPGGYDALLLEAEEINPVFSPSNFQGFELDPFPPIGTKIGSFLLFTTVESDVDYNSNIFASPDAEGDTALEVRPAARLTSNWSRHALEFRASGDFSFHDRFPSEDDRAYLLETLGRVDVTSFTNFQGFAAHEEAQESRSAINAQSAGTRPNIVVDRLRGAFNQRFNRLSMQLRGAKIDTSYGDDLIDGVVQSNADRNFTLYEQAVRPKWEFSPYFFVFSDISFNQRDYDVPADTDGIMRTSSGQRYRAGVSFGDVSQILRGTISLGYGKQTPNSPELPVIDGLLIDADLAWQISPLTVLNFTATSEVAETITAGSGGVMERTYGLEARHAFTRSIVGSAGVGYMTRDFVGAAITEDQFTAGTGVEYYMNQWAVLFARYQHTDFQSTQPESSYTVEEVQAGVRLRH